MFGAWKSLVFGSRQRRPAFWLGWSSGEGDEGNGAALDGVPGEGGGDDGVVVAARWGGVAVVAAGQAFDGVAGEFAEQDGVVEQA